MCMQRYLQDMVGSGRHGVCVFWVGFPKRMECYATPVPSATRFVPWWKMNIESIFHSIYFHIFLWNWNGIFHICMQDESLYDSRRQNRLRQTHSPNCFFFADLQMLYAGERGIRIPFAEQFARVLFHEISFLFASQRACRNLVSISTAKKNAFSKYKTMRTQEQYVSAQSGSLIKSQNFYTRNSTLKYIRQSTEDFSTTVINFIVLILDPTTKVEDMGHIGQVHAMELVAFQHAFQ